MTRIIHTLPGGTWSLVRGLLLMGTATTLGCGFSPQPKSGTVVCQPRGAACCPEGYLCVGRGVATAGGPSAGTCWSEGDLPPEAVVGVHDYTPATPNDPACMVTDWLPPEMVGIGVYADASIPDPVRPVATADAGPGATDAGGTGPVTPALGPRIAAAGQRTYLVAAGGLLGWGANDKGQLGDGTTTERMHPVAVTGLSAGVTTVAAGLYHACAVANGGVQCWGANGGGQLGNGTVLDSLVPVPVVGLESGATAVAVGTSHTCAVRNGGVLCWGYSLAGQIGDGTRVDSEVPIKVWDLPSGVTAISAGAVHTCALVNGGVRCWGGNDEGQLGDNTQEIDRKSPVDVVGLEAGVTAIAAGPYHTCAVVRGGLRCWGANGAGQLGNGTSTSSLVPVPVEGLSAKVASVACGTAHTCAIMDSGAARCWGSDMLAQLGNGEDLSSTTTWSQVVGLTSGVTGIAAAEYHTCALMANGGVKCWGTNLRGQLGYETSGVLIVPDEVPVNVQFR